MTIKGRSVSSTSLTLKGAAAIGAHVSSSLKNASKNNLTKLKTSKDKTADPKSKTRAKEPQTKENKPASKPATKPAYKPEPNKIATSGKAYQPALPGMRNLKQFKEPRGK